MSVAPSAGSFPVNVVKMTRILLVIDLHGVARFLGDVRTVHLAIIPVMVRDDTSKPGVMTVGMGDRTVKGVVGGAFAVVTTVELWAVPSIIGGIGDLAVEALIGSSGAQSGLGRC